MAEQGDRLYKREIESCNESETKAIFKEIVLWLNCFFFFPFEISSSLVVQNFF